MSGVYHGAQGNLWDLCSGAGWQGVIQGRWCIFTHWDNPWKPASVIRTVYNLSKSMIDCQSYVRQPSMSTRLVFSRQMPIPSPFINRYITDLSSNDIQSSQDSELLCHSLVLVVTPIPPRNLEPTIPGLVRPDMWNLTAQTASSKG
jgi:hypothetical protein